MEATSTREPTISTSSSSSASICAACGLCCNGTFFGRVFLHHDEIAGAKSRRLRVVPFDNREVVELPCAQHTGIACGIYEHRPASCAEYHCKILEAADEGSLSVAEAVSKVTEMKALARRIREAMPPGTAHLVLFEAAQSLFEGEDGAEWRRQNADVLLDMAVFLRRSGPEFGVGDKGPMGPTPDRPNRG